MIQIQDLHTSTSQNFSEFIMFFLCFFKIWNIIKKQPLQVIWRQTFKLFARTMKNNGFKFANFTIILNRLFVHMPSYLFML